MPSCKMDLKHKMEEKTTTTTIMVFALAEYLIWPFYKLLFLVWYMPMVIIGMCKKKKVCVPANEPPPAMLLPANKLVMQIANREISSKYLVECYISRIKEVNPVINAVVEERFVIALEEAEKVDEKIRSSDLSGTELVEQYPLLGIPITVKESIGVQGMSNAAGCFYAAGKRAEYDAEIVAKCKLLGAIIVAVTNTPELCMNWETHNNLTGVTKNPYDSRKTSGGSSGGEGALLGAGASLVGLGSDVAGSLRLPAHYCGIFSHKPTSNAVSTVGHYPISANTEKWNKHFILGPMARYASDLLPMMKVLVKDEFKTVLDLDKKVDITKVKIFYIKNYGSVLSPTLDREISNAFDFLLDHFKIKYNLEVKPLRKDFFNKTMFAVVHTLIEIDQVQDFFYNKPRTSTIWELVKILFHCSSVSFSAVLFKCLRKYAKIIPESAHREGNMKVDSVREELEELLGDDGVLLMPSFHRTANYHHTTTPTCLNTINAMAFNATGMPVSSAPIGWHSDGLPFGIQIISRRFNDRVPIAVAEEIEQICGGWRLPQPK